MPIAPSSKFINVAIETSIKGLMTIFANSKGEPVMSDEDVKLALLDTMMALKHQMKINEILTKRIEDIEARPQRKIF